MLRSPICLIFSLLILTLTLTLTPVLALHPSYPDEFNITSTPILQEVLKEISSRQKWNDEVRFSKLEVKKIRVGSGRSFEVQIRVGKSRFAFVFPDEVSAWRSVHGRDVKLESMVKEVNSTTVLDPVALEGPFELRVAGDDHLSLSLPMNISHTGLKRVIVSEGISVEVRKAQGVSLFHSSHQRFPASEDKEKPYSWSFDSSMCVLLPPIRIVGSASLVAHRTLNADSQIKTLYLSDDTIRLLPEKCYNSRAYLQPRSIDLLGLKIDRLEKLLSFLGNRSRQIDLMGSMTAKLKASGMLRFQLEIERGIESTKSLLNKTAEWRTKPKVERVWFEVTAKVEAEKLKPKTVRKVVPFIEVDTEAWSSLMSNISFTKFPSLLVPQEALTLDVKW
ncbi:PREDICTED: uncharacterized protein LOC104815190 [Tarenaya hassleriana]|uniref:uncharacterized protein LOC104815190 n=1 Tax=Tarenaya hassleriana TaxID=28532 RepID=UPI00053CA040|nr:PREDICTED: uncharacterized protein LOC104815190 [Tarenaya hassleriana]